MVKNNAEQNLRWDLLVRFRLIEIIALWEGRITTTHLINSFGIARQQASKNINYYLTHIAPNNLVYDATLRGYKPTSQFSPKLTEGKAEEYLQALVSNKSLSHRFYVNLDLTNIEQLQAPLRQVQPDILRTLVQAIRNNQKVDIGYVSLFSPDEESRIIAPHSLTCTPLRWHVRAYCEKNQGFRDFVLNRFRSVYAIEGSSSMKQEHDALWNKSVAVEIHPDPRLSDYQKSIIEHDYNMENGKTTLNTRAALIPYLLQTLNIDLNYSKKKPEAQQIIVHNLDEIKSYVFGAE